MEFMHNHPISFVWRTWPVPGATKLLLFIVTLVTTHNEPFSLLVFSFLLLCMLGVTTLHMLPDLQL